MEEIKESEIGKVLKVAGPLVIAEQMGGAFKQELVKVGWDKSVGEIIKLDKDTAAIQCYEDTSGLTIGDPIIRTKSSLSVELGPGILNKIYDGIQRPLKEIYEAVYEVNPMGAPYVPKGVELPALDRKREWEYDPVGFRVGDIIKPGDIYGAVVENQLFKNHKVMLPPTAQAGRVTYIAPSGNYNVTDKILEVEYEDKTMEYAMYHLWPVRKPRPTQQKLSGEHLLETGQRVLDALFPSVLGGTCCIPGAFGCGKTCISQALSKYSNSQGIIYVGCGERGNEMAEVLHEFPELTIKVDGVDQNIMQRTCLVANTSNMPVAAREASIYTGITLAEYFRDMGYDMAMMADSTSRWAEALREISGRLAEMPAEQGYPAYMPSRLAEFYERAGKVTCLGSPEREGSVTIVGAVSPPGGDFSDPVTTATLNIVQVFWGLEKKLAQKKHFPSVDWNQSYSNYEEILAKFLRGQHENFVTYKTIIKKLLQEEGQLAEIVRLVGKDSLSEDQKLILWTAGLIKQEFLQQNAFSDYDYTCPLWKTYQMMETMCYFYELAHRTLMESDKEKKIDFKFIETTMKTEMDGFNQMKFQSPTEDNRSAAEKWFRDFRDTMANKFKGIQNM